MKIHQPELNKRTIIRWKVYFDRSRMYIGYIQFFLIGIVFLKSFKDNPWGEWIFKYAIVSIPVAFLLFVILSLVLGYFDSKLGLREEEQRNLSKSNPVMMEMLDQLKELNKKIELLETEKINKNTQ
jgi:phosphotransferase system  glucose/maltose/N-acetylglucosamine-specific IIC component